MTMMTHQAARDLLLMSTLDISAGAIHEWVVAMDDERRIELSKEPVGPIAVGMYEALVSQGTLEAESTAWYEARGDYLQAIASASDQTLRELVTLVTGTDPLASVELGS